MGRRGTRERLARAPILDRENELAQIDHLAGEVLGGSGRVIVAEGAAGAGKTRVLAAAAERLRERGLRVLEGRGSELDMATAFGLARRLFVGAVAGGPRAERRALVEGVARHALPVLGGDAPGPPVRDRRRAIVEGLTALAENLTRRDPLGLVIDDLHWADEPSVGWLAHLLDRIDRLPILVLCGVRMGDPGADSPAVAAVRLRLEVETLDLAPLGTPAVGRLVEEALGKRPDPSFASACRDRTGGNPFLLGELLVALDAAGTLPDADAAPRISQVRLAGVSRSVQGRLRSASRAAASFAEAAAVLGSGSLLRHAAKIAGLTEGPALSALDELAALGILRPDTPLEFLHPLVRSAVHDGIASGRRAELHKAAAHVLAGDPANADAVAAHLLETEPMGDRWVVERLCTAAAAAMVRGGAASAASYLTRAFAEPPAEDAVAEVRVALGEAEARLDRPEAAVEHLRAALSSRPSPELRARAAIELSLSLGRLGRIDEALDALDREAATAGDPELRLTLEGAYAGFAFLRAPVAARLGPRVEPYAELEGRTRGERELIAIVARTRAFAGRPAEESVPLAHRALASGSLLGSDAMTVPAWGGALSVLTLAEEVDSAERAIAAAIAEARSEVAIFELGFALHIAATLALRLGHIDEVAALAREGAALVAEHELQEVMPMMAGHLVSALTEKMRLAEARAALEGFGLAGELPDQYFAIPPLVARARLALAEGDLATAADGLAEAGRLYTSHGVLLAMQPWRSELALLIASTEPERAEGLVADELALARRFGAPGPIGTAMRAQGILVGGRAGLDLLEESARVLRGSAQELELARSLIELGATRRRLGEPAAARDCLREAAAIADRGGAAATSARARDELAATGARRLDRVHLHGREALTPSELRTARMAASGMSNAEIAQALFVSPKTVETHLRSAFRKLEVTSRRDLPRDLLTAPADPP